jgi:four helix bundle protein
MATIQRFEDLLVWQGARALTKSIYDLSGKGVFAKDFELRDQIRRAAISVRSNLAEGFERSGNREFQQFLATAKGSLGEVRAQLYIALDLQYIAAEDFKDLNKLALEISSMVAGLSGYLDRQSKMKGLRFKGREANNKDLPTSNN